MFTAYTWSMISDLCCESGLARSNLECVCVCMCVCVCVWPAWTDLNGVRVSGSYQSGLIWMVCVPSRQLVMWMRPNGLFKDTVCCSHALPLVQTYTNTHALISFQQKERGNKRRPRTRTNWERFCVQQDGQDHLAHEQENMWNNLQFRLRLWTGRTRHVQL